MVFGDAQVSGKLKEVILRLDKALNLIKTQEKEIQRLRALLLKNIVARYEEPNTENDEHTNNRL